MEIYIYINIYITIYIIEISTINTLTNYDVSQDDINSIIENFAVLGPYMKHKLQL